MSDPVLPFDLSRMLLGDGPPLVLLEVLLRTLVIYAYMFTLIRLLGRRTKSHLSILDILVILALGSAVGDGSLYPDVPVLHCLVVITVIVFVNKAIVVSADRHPALRARIEGEPRIVVSDGIVLTEELRRTGIGLHDLMELLRLKGVSNLGQIELVVLEPSCDVSIYRRSEPVPGLSILPRAAEAGDNGAASDLEEAMETCCEGCGTLHAADSGPCPRTGCGATGVRPRSWPRYALAQS
ncbi:MAG: YetF domain-containing protein [Pseudomonadota bacterium]